MGQEEVSVIIKPFEDNGNLFSNENREKDIQISGKELVMKTNGKKRIFALLMCVMMIVSSMSVWAAYVSKTIGVPAEDHALCELYLTTSIGRAFTTPASTANTIETTIKVETTSGDEFWAFGTTSATISKKNLSYAESTHQAGPYYATLSVYI